MTTDSKHIIGAQQYIVGLTDKAEAHSVQSTLSSLQHTRIHGLIEKIMDRFDQKDELIQFDSVTLDLGVLPKYNYEEELVLRLEEELIRFFDENVRLFGVSTEKGIQNRTERKLDQLEHFLLRGYLPWNAGTSVVPTRLLEELLKEDPEALVKLLNEQGRKHTVRKRMIWQFSDEQLDNVVVATSKNEGEYIISHRNKLTSYQRREAILPVGESDFRNAIWEIILSYLYVESKSYSGKKAFLKFLIGSIAKKYNLDYNILLTQMATHAHPEMRKQGHGDFERILLELEKEQKIGSESTRMHVKKEGSREVEILLKAVDHFIAYGMFTSEFPYHSRHVFNTRMLSVLQSEDPTIRFHLDRWLASAHSRRRLLAICDEMLLRRILELSPQPWVAVQSEFISALVTADIEMPAALLAIQKELLRIKASVIVGSQDFSGNSEKAVVFALLRSILSHFEQREGPLFEFLNDVSSKLRSGFRKPVTIFLMRFYHNKGEQLLDRFSDEILMNLRALPYASWPEEIQRVVLAWTRKTGMSSDALLKTLGAYLKKKKASNNLVTLVDHIRHEMKGGDAAYLATLPVVAEIIKDLPKHNGRRRRWELFRFVLISGRLPWWDASYTWSTFNKDAEWFWQKKSYRKKVMAMVRSEKALSGALKKLTSSNMYHLWKAVGPIEDTRFREFLIGVDGWIASKLIPLAFVKGASLETFRVGLLNTLSRSRGASGKTAILKYIESWIKESIPLRHGSMSAEILRILDAWPEVWKGVSKNRFLEQCGIQLPKGDAIDVIKAPRTIDRFVAEFSDIGFSETPSEIKKDKARFAHFLSLVLAHTDTFSNWLSEASFRTELLTQLDRKEQATFIHKVLQKPQSEYYFESVQLFNDIKSHLTTSEFDKLWTHFSQLVLFRMASGGFASWQRADWIHLIWHSIIRILGEDKATNMLTEHFGIDEPEDESASSEARTVQELLAREVKKKTLNPNNIERKTSDREEEEYRKLGEELPHEFLDPVFVQNAGIIIIAPYLGMLFTKCGLFESGNFKDRESTLKALYLVHYAATGRELPEEHELVMAKVLCGVPIGLPVQNGVTLTQHEKETTDSLLLAVTQQWPGLETTSIDGLRTTFLQREGKLEEEEDQFYLKVEQKSYDMLLDKIPWNITKIKLSWMPKILTVTWR